MRIESVKLENVRTFAPGEETQFDPGLNIVIGPNAGGKSSLSDAMMLVMRAGILLNRGVESGADERGPYLSIVQRPPIENLASYLARAGGDQSGSVTINLVVDDEDIAKMSAIRAAVPHLRKAAARYRNLAAENVTELATFDIDSMRAGTIVPVRVAFSNIEPPNGTPPAELLWPDDKQHQDFLRFLRYYLLLADLGQESGRLSLGPLLYYVSPSRSFGSRDFEAKLSETDRQVCEMVISRQPPDRRRRWSGWRCCTSLKSIADFLVKPKIEVFATVGRWIPR